MNIFQIYNDVSLIPDFVEKNIKKLNPTYNYKFLNFTEGKEIINDHFEGPLKERILYCIDKYPRYCHKSDLLRYCLLYIYGGVYLDVDLKPMVSFDKMIHNDVDFFTSFGRGGKPTIINGTLIYPITSNGILKSKKKNPILLDLINYAITNEKLFDSDPEYRGENVFYLYKYLNEKCIKNKTTLEPFKKIKIDGQQIYLVNHVLIPEHNLDCLVDKDKLIIHANDPKYNFKRQSSSFI